MAGRKPLKLDDFDYTAVMSHIIKLPFLRKCEKKLYTLFESGKQSTRAFTPEDFETLKKCRYEKNAFEKRQTLLQLILATDPTHRTTLEQIVAVLSNQEQIDAYFTMHDTLDLLLRKTRTALAEKNAVKKVDAALRPKKENEDDSKKYERKQRDRENYFLGAYIRKFLNSSDFHKKENEIQRVARLFDLAEPEKREHHRELYREAKYDSRNPFD